MLYTRPQLGFFGVATEHVSQHVCPRLPPGRIRRLPSGDLSLSSQEGVSEPTPSIGPTSSDDVTVR